MFKIEDILTRGNGENDFQYHKRLVYGKLIDKTLDDIDYSELSEIVYGQQYSSDVARRMMYGSCRTLKLLDAAKNMSALQDNDSELSQRMRDFEKCRQKYYDQRREYKKELTKESRLENIEDRLVDAAQTLSDTIGDVFPIDGIRCLETTPATDGTEAVLVLSDWHYGMNTNNIWNTYDTDICISRVYKIICDAKERILRHSCSKLHIFMLGDFIHGAIHASARVASEELVADQLMQVSELLAQSIINLSKVVPEIHVYTTYGNHARTVQDKKDSIHRDNMERIIPWWMKERVKSVHGCDIVIHDDFDTEYIHSVILGHGFCCTHGDLDNVRQAPRLMSTLFHKKYGTDIEYVILADKHHSEGFSELGIDSMICGSLCGADEYSNAKRLYASCEQLLMIVTEEDGVDAIYRLKCQ